MLFTHKMDSLYIERAKVLMEHGRPIYCNQEGRFNIPVNNLQVILLGRGTSITHDAAECFSVAGVPLIFTGAAGMPYLTLPASQFHPTELQRGWIDRWQEDTGRLNMAKSIFAARIAFGIRHADENIVPKSRQEDWLTKAQDCSSLTELLGIEGDRVHWLYSQYAIHHSVAGFHRNHDQTDPDAPDVHARINAYLSHGNALAYGIAGAAMWHLGLSPAYPLVHGLSRNGGLVFDAADLVKDTTVLPWAFECHGMGVTTAMHELRFRIKHQKADKYIMDTLTKMAKAESHV